MDDPEDPWLTEDQWRAAADPDCPPGVVRIDGQPFPLIEYTDDGDHGVCEQP